MKIFHLKASFILFQHPFTFEAEGTTLFGATNCMEITSEYVGPPNKNDYKSAEKTDTNIHISPCRRISKHTFLYFNSASRRQYSNISWTASLSSVRRSLRSSPCDPASL